MNLDCGPRETSLFPVHVLLWLSNSCEYHVIDVVAAASTGIQPGSSRNERAIRQGSTFQEAIYRSHLVKGGEAHVERGR